MEIGGESKRRQMGYLYSGSGFDKGDSCVGQFQPNLG